jgi:hypothetical protein
MEGIIENAIDREEAGDFENGWKTWGLPPAPE